MCSSDLLLTEPHRLSGGQKQRIAIASVLAISPQVIILDEATAMLDPRGRTEIMNTVSTVRKQHEMSLITITHDLTEVIHAERVIVMNKGEIWAENDPRGIFAKKEELQEIGLDVPFVTTLANELKEAGIIITSEPLNHRELLEDLWISHLKM